MDQFSDVMADRRARTGESCIIQSQTMHICFSLSYHCTHICTHTHSVLEGSGTTLTMEYRTIVNRTLVSIEELGPEGLITTDNFNESLSSLEGFHAPNQDKIWQIRIPQNCQLWIVFEEFEVESTEDCEKDYFSVQTSKNQADIRKYCKSLESITVQRRKRVQLWFHADESIERRGLLARYCFRAITQNSTQQRSCNCNQEDSYTQRQRRSGITSDLCGQNSTLTWQFHY